MLPQIITLPDGSRLRLREALPTDAAALVALYRDVLAEGRYFITRLGELSDTPERRAAMLRGFARQDNAACLIAHRRDGPLLGMISIRGGTLSRMRHVGKLEILVSAEARGQGVGRALMVAGLAWAEENPVLRKVGLSVFADNTRAVALYRSLGFEEEGHRRGEYIESDGTLRDDLLLYRWVERPAPPPPELPDLFRG